ncbi:MAG TPA: nuclear transport factor 2 family protein [Burkholderiales bacterium]|nr:nuclear transport factor 2 family protein [Burkholderiales bacterium]
MLKMNRVIIILVTLAACPMTAVAADATDPRESDRKQLLQIFSEIVEGINEQNIDRMVAQMDENATVIWLNAEASRGHADIKAYYQRMVGTGDAILKKYNTKAKVAVPARFLGDIAVADGTMEDEFFPIRRGPFKLNSNWSVTCVKQDGKWKIAHLHLSTNVFNNELLDEVKQMVWYAAGGGLLAGLALMFGIGRLTRGKSTA